MSSLKSIKFSEFVDKGIESTPRRLRFDFNALADFEQINGMGLGQLLSMKAVFGTARAMLWAGCKWDDGTLTLEKTGDLLGEYLRAGGSVDIVLSKCFEAAIEQGAIGTAVQDEGDDDDQGNVSPSDQKALKEASKPGPSGSKKPKS